VVLVHLEHWSCVVWLMGSEAGGLVGSGEEDSEWWIVLKIA